MCIGASLCVDILSGFPLITTSNFFIGTWIFYPIVWVVGSEGTGALGMMQEVALTVILDLIAKVCQTNPPHVMPMCVSAS